MNKIVAALFCFFLSYGLQAQTQIPYDQALADSLGADEYGMKAYVLVILKTGANTTADKQVVNRLFKGHMENIQRLVEQKKLIVAGPLAKNEQTYRGIFILNVKTLDEARNLVQTDPAVQGNLLAAEYFQWYGSAALPLYLNASERITKKKP